MRRPARLRGMAGGALAVAFILPVTGMGRGEAAALAAGPMVGYSTMREVALWAQTTGPASVAFAYWPEDTPSDVRVTPAVPTRAAGAHTATVRVEALRPGTRYRYQLRIDGVTVDLPYPARFQTQALWQWRADPPDFTVALASCLYVNEPEYDRPGDPYGSNFRILEELVARAPDAMIWGGDNTYLREADWNSRSGILHRYGHTRAYPGLQPLLAATHHYATWDDHDFGPNNADRGWWAKELTLEAFRLFWPNPSYGIPDSPGVTTTFEWADAQFFLLDNRYHRTPNDRVTGDRTVLGQAQLRWLIDNLVSSTATFRFVVMGGQFLNPVADFESYATYPEERSRILAALEQERIPGVLFISGDRHRTELSVLQRGELYPLRDLTVSPLTAGPFAGEPEPNTLRDPGTLVQDHNFALLRIEGARTDRVLTITVVDAQGQERWSRVIRGPELYRGTR